MNESQVRIGNTLICSGKVLMIIPQGGKHVRQVEIRLPKFSQEPTVTATIYGGVGNVFGIYSIKVNLLQGFTQISITAAHVQAGVGIDSDYFCNYIVIGESISP
jgi:hypothetical protein